MDERKLTLIVVPHGDLETRTFEISYRKLKVLGWISFAVGCVGVFMVALWWSIAAQAARVQTLEKELKKFETQRMKVDSLDKLLADVEVQYARVRELLGADAPSDGRPPTLPELPKDAAQKGNQPAAPPVLDGWPLGTVRGAEIKGLTLDTEHPALDIGVPQATYIRAVGEGTVTAAAEDSIYGKYVKIDHGGGYESMYSHASTLLVSRGDRIKRQQVIALSGSSGKSTQPHLHFEIRVNGVPVDPRRFVRQP
jgi:murein DD-endopeptidase MepM/ murein hydrolase activator NlpD